MNDFPAQGRMATPLFLHTGCVPESTQHEMYPITGTASIPSAARTWVAKLVSYAPVALIRPYPVQRVFWVNGSTVTTTNVDMGIYSADGVRIYNTGSTVMSGASTAQYVTPATPFVLGAGMYYFAWTCDSTTSRGQAYGGTANGGRMLGLLEETTGSFGLPATMTPVAWARAWGTSVVGVTRTTTGF